MTLREQILSEIARYHARHTDLPAFILMDGDTFLELVSERGIVAAMTMGGMTFYGLKVVVLPTDGLPLLKIVGQPGHEAMRAVSRPARSA